MPEDTRHLVQRQFGTRAANFVTSTIHAQGPSLHRLIELVSPQPGWRVLDVATGGGHTALAFARQSCQVIAADLTLPMLQAARSFIEEQQAERVAYCQMDAERLPFLPNRFDCVTCRIAAHHFPDVAAFVREATRVLKPGGLLAIADNVVGGETKVSRSVNAFEQLRDPSHHWAYASEDWEDFLFAAGLNVTHFETFQKEVDFDEWAARMGVTGDDLTRLRVLLAQAPEGMREWLRPRRVGGRLVFLLIEMVMIGRKP